MEKLTEQIINEKIEALRQTLLANLRASEAEVMAKQAKTKAHNDLRLAREEVHALTTGDWEI